MTAEPVRADSSLDPTFARLRDALLAAVERERSAGAPIVRTRVRTYGPLEDDDETDELVVEVLTTLDESAANALMHRLSQAARAANRSCGLPPLSGGILVLRSQA